MKRLWVWAVGTALLIVVSGGAYKLSQLDWKEVSIVVGLQSEARKSPVYVLNKFLSSYGVSVEQGDDFYSLFDPLSMQLNRLSDDFGLVVDEALFENDDDLMSSLYNWVESGGHLVYVLSRSRTNEKTNWLFDQLSPSIERVEEPAKPIYDVTGIGDEVNATTDIDSDVDLALYIPHRFVFKECHSFEWEVLDDDYQTLACHQAIGDGYVTMLSDASFFNGFGLRIANNASMTLSIFSHASAYGFFQSDLGVDWVSMLFGQHWAHYALLVTLLAMLFWNLYARFGPSLVPHEQRYSHFGQHLENLARFYRQNGHELHLKKVLLDELDATMEKKVMGFSDSSREQKVEILIKETSTDKAFATQLLDSKNISSNAFWLEQVRFVKELKV